MFSVGTPEKESEGSGSSRRPDVIEEAVSFRSKTKETETECAKQEQRLQQKDDEQLQHAKSQERASFRDSCNGWCGKDSDARVEQEQQLLQKEEQRQHAQRQEERSSVRSSCNSCCGKDSDAPQHAEEGERVVVEEEEKEEPAESKHLAVSMAAIFEAEGTAIAFHSTN
jgi:hypothetical protein